MSHVADAEGQEGHEVNGQMTIKSRLFSPESW